MTTAKPLEICVIDINMREQKCHRCGAIVPLGFGLPVGDDGSYVPNWFEGDWAGVAACESCYRWHEAWSETTDPKRKTQGSRLPEGK